MSDKTYWVLEMQGVESGEVDARKVFDNPDNLANFVRVNAQDAFLMRIAIADEANLVELRLAEAFDDEPYMGRTIVASRTDGSSFVDRVHAAQERINRGLAP